MDPHTTQLASGPYEVQTRLTQIAQAAMPSGLIADEVCPRVRSGYKFTYTTLSEEDLLTIPDVRASRAGRLNQVEFGATDTTASVVDYGLEDPVPSRDIEEARAQEVAYDPLEQAAISTAELVKLARERRVADLVTTASSYAAGHSTSLNGNAQWSHASSNPRKVILEALDVPLVRPNTLVFGQKVWTALRQHPKIVEAVAATGAGDQASGIVVKEAVAELFEVDRVLVGMAWYQSAKRGQEDSFARLWGKHACAIHVRRDMASSRDRMPKFCWTADALGGLQVGTYEEPARGVNRGSTVVKVSECVKELVAYSRAGYLWRNAVAYPMTQNSSAPAQARPADHLCGLGYSPADPRQSAAESEVCQHAERLLNMVHAYCKIRNSWTGWLRIDAMSRTLYERIVPEMRALRDAERHIVDTPSVTLLSVLDYAARARKAVPAFTPRETIDYPQPPVSDAVRKASKRMSADAQQAALAARQASARTYAAGMTQAIERERAEEERRQQAMVDAGVTETPEEAAGATAAVEARIAVYERERRRALADAGLNPDGTLSKQAANASEARGTTVAWRVASRGLRAIRLEPTPETRPAFVRRLVLIDRGARGGTLRAFGEPMLDGRRETINGIAVRFAHKRRDRYEGPLTLTQVREMRA